MYQSVLASSPDTCCFKVLINCVFKPSTFTSPTDLSLGKSPSSESSCVHKLSACALGVAVPHDLVTWLSAKE